MWLDSAYGAFGHSIGDSTSPIDLDAAIKKGPSAVWMGKMAKFLLGYRFQLLEGAELVKSYDPKIPLDTLT